MKMRILTPLIILFCMACGSANQTKKDAAEIQVSQKIILKAANNNYVTINQENSFLLANQPDSAKAERFEVVDMGNGKSALKSSGGKFVSADLGQKASLIANRDAANEWETFSIIKLDQSKINITNSTGKFVSADLGLGGYFFANREKPGDWETFSIEIK